MSVEENKAILLRAAENFSSKDSREDYFQIYDTNAVVHGYPGVEPGIDSIKQFYRTFWAAFPDSQLTLDDAIAEGDEVACHFTLRATHQGEFMGIPPSGRQVTLTGITILRFAGGKCVERWSQADFLGLMQQLGAIPAPAQVTG